jgi:class 3 adenylate cyclase
MAEDYPHELLEDTSELSGYRGWKEHVYHDFLALQRGSLSHGDFRKKYCRKRAVLSLDMTGFTSGAINIGELESLLRILDAQRVCIPVLRDFGAELIRCFADDVVAVFEDPEPALNAAFEIHRRTRLFNNSKQASSDPTQCCIGIGFGELFAIGPNLAQGDEMNRASKLGEDIARARETLLTERAFAALNHLGDIQFELQSSDDQLFPFYRAIPAG